MKLTRWQANLFLLLTAIIWGTSYIFIKQALKGGMPAGLINSLRGIIFVFFVYLFFHKTINRMSKKDFKVGLISGIINLLGYQLQTIGLKYTTPANSAFLTATYIVIIPFIVWIFWKKRPLVKSFVAISLCFLGTLFLTNMVNTGLTFHLGDLLTLLSALFYSLQIIYFSNTAAKINPFTVTFMLGSVQALGCLAWSLIFETNTYSTIHWSVAIWPVLILGFFASFGAQTLQVIGQKYTDSTSAGLILMTESLFASFFSVILGFEQLTHNLLLGGILIVAAIFIMEFNPHQLFFLKKRKKLSHLKAMNLKQKNNS
ncbi:DMT family transporter [Liquorilactobacillus oeni]|uniref:Transport protein n=1 Tax=Liquorilactobacillus oeni DSM 19972 TaxID=1423777 RepID=A0A0R1MA12_9LACO|nr:DMT family transporter [Liquorilactobacillus oeni]KRL05181.1 transport protein [Liquorilactobacillus oeni DSM 19972]